MKLENADRRVLAVCIAAGAAMLLCFVLNITAASPRDALTWEPPGQARAAADAIDINTAGFEELITLPGIGETRAQAILDDRAANGPFRCPEDLIRVQGIGEGILSGILDQITTGGYDDAENFSG